MQPVQAFSMYQHLQLDLIEMPVSSSGNRYGAILIDIFSKYVWAKSLISKEATLVVDFMQSVVSKFGTFDILQTDHGSEFENKFMKEFVDAHKIGKLI